MPLRLTTGEDLRLTLGAWIGQQREQAGCLISGIGRLSVAHLCLLALLALLETFSFLMIGLSSLVPLLLPPPPPPMPDQRDGSIA